MNLGVDVSEYKGKTIGIYGGKFLPFHGGHKTCIIEASKQVDVLFVVIGYDDEWDKALCEGTNFKWVNARTRERWISESFVHHSNIRVLSQYEKRSDDYMNDESVVQSNLELLKKVGGKIDFCFSSEPSYEEYFAKVQPNSKHIVLDPMRSKVNISATEIREGGVYKYWDLLPKSVQKHYVKRVCIIGTESTGKTTLCRKLSEMYDTNWVGEYGRIFYEELGSCYDVMYEKDFVKIACGHNHKIEEAVEDANKVLFIDTDNIYTQFFMVEQFGKVDSTISSIIYSGTDEIDLYLYLKPVIPHELDGMRQLKTKYQIEEDDNLLTFMYKDLYGKNIVVVDQNNIDEIKEEIDKLLGLEVKS